MSNLVEGQRGYDDSDRLEDEDGDLTEEEFCDLLTALFEGELLEDHTDSDVDVDTFEQAGLLTRDNGIVVKIGDQEFQVTVVENRRRRYGF